MSIYFWGVFPWWRMYSWNRVQACIPAFAFSSYTRKQSLKFQIVYQLRNTLHSSELLYPLRRPVDSHVGFVQARRKKRSLQSPPRFNESAQCVKLFTDARFSIRAALQSGEGLELSQLSTFGTRHFDNEKSPVTDSYAWPLHRDPNAAWSLGHRDTASMQR